MASSTTRQRRVLVSPEELIGHAIDGKYRLDSIIGGGGMGMVYRATQQNLNRPVALKLLKLPKDDSQKSLERFQREIDIVAQLSHPNIVRVFDSGVDPELGLHYIAMELIEGVGLDRLVAHWKFEPALSLEIARGICAALTEPHRLGIVHRDIKPGNILLTVRSDDTLGVKVVDFGISRSTQVAADNQITSTGEVIGSPQYMAPEAARGVEIDARTDLYAVGVLLYEMISGRPLFQAPTPILLMLQHLRERPPSLHDLQPAELLPIQSVPPVVSAMVDRLLSKDPKDRPSSAREMLRELDTIRDVCDLHLPRLNGNLSALGALRPWIHPLNPEALGENPLADESEMVPYFEGWLVPDTAEFLAPISAPSQSNRPQPQSGDNAWQHAHTLPLDTQEELAAQHAAPPNTTEFKHASGPRSITQPGTGPLVSRSEVETTEKIEPPTPAKPDRTPIWLMGAGVVALLITSAVIFWPTTGAPIADAPIADAPNTDAPPETPTLKAPSKDAPAHAFGEPDAGSNPDASTSEASTPEADISEVSAEPIAPKKPVKQKEPAKQKPPAKPQKPAQQEQPAKQNTHTKPKEPAEAPPSSENDKLEEGLDWLRKR